MKKKSFLISATILAVILSFTVLGFSIYAVINQSIAVKNTISFAGKTNNLHFIIDGRITGTTEEEDPVTHWDYDYERDGIMNHNWVLNTLTFNSEGLTVDQINITYTFKIQNLSSEPLVAIFNGPENLIDGLNKNYYVSRQEGISLEEGSRVEVDINQTGTMVLKLTINSKENFSCNQSIDFAIDIFSLESV